MSNNWLFCLQLEDVRIYEQVQRSTAQHSRSPHTRRCSASDRGPRLEIKLQQMLAVGPLRPIGGAQGLLTGLLATP